MRILTCWYIPEDLTVCMPARCLSFTFALFILLSFLSLSFFESILSPSYHTPFFLTYFLLISFLIPNFFRYLSLSLFISLLPSSSFHFYEVYEGVLRTTQKQIRNATDTTPVTVTISNNSINCKVSPRKGHESPEGE